MKMFNNTSGWFIRGKIENEIAKKSYPTNHRLWDATRTNAKRCHECF